MKKYVKPELFYEHYELSQHIADCAWELNSADKYACAAVADPNWGVEVKIFMEYAMCDILEENAKKDIDGYCYMNGTEGFNVFKS